MNAADEGRIPSPILDEAAEWLVRLQDSGCTDVPAAMGCA